MTLGRALRLSRIFVQVVALALITLVLVGGSVRLAISLGWIARIQLLPLVLSASFASLAVWAVLTLIFGRVYCSSVCPMGTLQDCISRLPRTRKQWRNRHPYHYTPSNNPLRYGILGAVALCIILSFGVVYLLLDPYSAFARIEVDLLKPAVQWIGGKEVIKGTLLGGGIAFATLAAVGAVAWRRGRTICNTVCPVGAALSLISRYSLYHIDIDTDVCIGCRRCERVCKARCINLNDRVVDSSRCVVCFDCLDTCQEGAISYTTRRKMLATPMLRKIETTPTATSEPCTDAPASSASSSTSKADGEKVAVDRRKFLATALMLATVPAIDAVASKVEKGKAAASGKEALKPRRPVAPPGRSSMASFLDRCTGCGLCMSHCPENVLRPSAGQYGWLHPLHPVMKYEEGFCEYNCTRCTDLCPTGALQPLTVEEKHIFIIGHARVSAANCVGCGRCARACPRRTIEMVERPDGGRRLAVVHTDACIGCGKCQYVCPVSPKAIVVDGIV